MYYTDLSGKSVPLNYRIYNKQEDKTKNDYLREMIAEILGWGLEPETVTTDAWYSSKDNIKFFVCKLVQSMMVSCQFGYAKLDKMLHKLYFRHSTRSICNSLDGIPTHLPVRYLQNDL